MFQFPRFALLRVIGLQPTGLPHSDIFGSLITCISPKLFAAYHVLLRQQEPRHPPYALPSFLISFVLAYSFSYSYNLSKNFYLILLIRYCLFILLIEMTNLNSNLSTSACGEYRSRTDDPLLAKQVL